MDAEFLGSFMSTQELPKTKERKIAFLGRSNVGKSSLINLLAGTKIAKVSKTPGRTQTVNLFRIGGKVIFGDFPGYGYAKLSKEKRREWKHLVEKFLTSNYFDFAVQIVDARHPGLESDLQLNKWMQYQKLPHVVVLNKSDKLNRKERVEVERKARLAFSGQPLLFASAFTKEGKQELDKLIRTLMLGSSTEIKLGVLPEWSEL